MGKRVVVGLVFVGMCVALCMCWIVLLSQLRVLV